MADVYSAPGGRVLGDRRDPFENLKIDKSLPTLIFDPSQHQQKVAVSQAWICRDAAGREV